MKEPQYHVYIRNDWPLPFVQPWAVGPINVAKPPFRWNFILVANLGNKYAWCYHAKDLFKLGHNIDHYLANPKNLAKFKQQAKQAEMENRSFAAKISKINLDKLSIQELTNLLRQWYTIHNRFTAAFMPIDATDETLEADIKTAIRDAKIDLSVYDLAALLTPQAPTYVQREHKDFCNLAKKFWNRFDSPASRKAIAKHIAKWWWTAMGWGQHRPLNDETIRKNLIKIKNLKELLAIQKRDEQTRNATLRLKKKLIGKLPKNVKQLLDAFEILAKMHDTRKEIQMKMMTAGLAITKVLLQKSDISLAFRNFILVEEYLSLANGIKPNLQELYNRTKAYWCQFTFNKKMLMLSGQKAINRIKRSNIDGFNNHQNGNLIKGVSASPGIAKGRARVELSAQILNRTIKSGEILVTSQTTPEFAPAMKKAAAIITDEGGITSHAAIVSRELGIPCVIGTKIATKALKNGDVVEVNANDGIVKKIK